MSSRSIEDFGRRNRGEEYEPLMGDDASSSSPTRVKQSCWTYRCLLLFLSAFVLICAIVIVSALVYYQEVEKHSAVGYYKTAAVASDAGPCSTVGRKIMEDHNGSGVDAAIATLLCLGLYNPQSMGLGGGFFMTIYAKPVNGSQKEVATLDAREMAPMAATPDMYVNGTSSTVGAASVAVPGEIRGYYAAWQKYGKLAWKELFQPAIEMNKKGVPVSKELAIKIDSNFQEIRKHEQLRNVFLSPDDFPLEEGELVHRPTLTNTLEKLSNVENVEDFYTGGMAEDIIADLNDGDCGGGNIMTLEDLKNYTAKWRKPVQTQVGEWSMASLPPPSSGPVLHFVLNVMDGYNYTAMPEEMEEKVLMYHRWIEALKFGFAIRTRLGDEDFVNVTEVVRNLTSRSYADSIRARITDSTTHPPSWYGPAFLEPQRESGTSHLNVYAPDGSVVAVTSTVNTEFASKCLGYRTGIIFNNEMDDFATKPGVENFYHMLSTEANRIEGGKRPLSSMVPSVVFSKDENGEDVVDVIGASGGAHIMPAVAFVSFHHQMLGMNLETAIDTPRLHHQLTPNIVEYESNIKKDIIAGLAKKGHELKSISTSAVVQGITILCQPDASSDKACIEAVSDHRKFGAPDGY